MIRSSPKTRQSSASYDLVSMNCVLCMKSGSWFKQNWNVFYRLGLSITVYVLQMQCESAWPQLCKRDRLELFFWKPETFKYSRFRCYKSMGVFLTWTIKIIFLRFLCHFQSLIFKSSATIETVRYIFQKKTRLKWLSASKAAQ